MVLKDGEHACNVCGTMFDTAQGLAAHGQVHDEEVITKVLVECEVCGETERTHPCKVDDYVTCSNECWGKRISQQRETERVKVACKICGAEEEVSVAVAEDYKTCSDMCRREWMSQLMTGKNNPNFKGGATISSQ